MEQFFTGKFQGNLPVISTVEYDAEVIENGGDAGIIAKLLTCIYGTPWSTRRANEEDKEFNFIIFR